MVDFKSQSCSFKIIFPEISGVYPGTGWVQKVPRVGKIMHKLD